jgi:hypothetical protein
MDPIFFMDKGGLPLKKALNSDARLLQSILLELSIHFRRGVFFNDGQIKAQCCLCTPIDKALHISHYGQNS